jgi:hypothetical protein
MGPTGQDPARSNDPMMPGSASRLPSRSLPSDGLGAPSASRSPFGTRGALVFSLALVAGAFSAPRPLDGADGTFVRGDSNGDGFISIADVMAMVRYFHRSAYRLGCPDAADFDDSGDISVTDLVNLTEFIFYPSGRSDYPTAPFPEDGEDPTPDDLQCGVSAVQGAGQGGGAGEAVPVDCGLAAFWRDSGPVEGFGPSHFGQVIDFILFFNRQCIQAFPGQSELRLPILAGNRAELDGLSLSVRSSSTSLRLDRFQFEETRLEMFPPEWTFNYDHWSDRGYLAATVFMDFEWPFLGQQFPISVRPAHVADLVFSISPEARPGERFTIAFATTPPASEYGPPIGNEFSSEGQSLKPILANSSVTVEIAEPERLFVRGDANRDFRVSISDAISILGFLFLAQPALCLTAMDANHDVAISVTDAVYLMNYLFQAGPPPPKPHPHAASLLGVAPGDSFGERACAARQQ